MTTEREYREWEKRRQKRKNKGKSKFNILLILGIISLSGWYTWKEYKQEINSFLEKKIPRDLLNRKLKEQTQLNLDSILNNNEQPEELNINSNQDIEIGSMKEIKKIDFSSIDKSAASINYQGTSVTELASILSQYATNDAEKARIIYAWIGHNITYDVQGYLTGNYGNLSPTGVLASRKAVCSGYAKLYQNLAKAMGLEAIIIDGYAKGASYIIGEKTEINHAWNAVKINNNWYLLDSTWGAGYLNGKQFYQAFNPHYFATEPDQFIYDHFPTTKSWQLLAQPLTKEQFELLPEVSPQFFKQGMKFVSHNQHTIKTDDGKVVIALQAHPDTIVTSNLKSNGQKLAETYTYQEQKDGMILVAAAFPAPGSYELQIFAKNKHDSSDSYPHAVTYKIITKSASKEFPKTYSTFGENNVSLAFPLTRYLPANKLINFKLNVPNALEVQVIDESSNKWTKLNRYGTQFSGDVRVGSGKIQVTAKFPGNQQYWTLVEYN